MAGVKPLRKLQVGVEVTAGTAVAATDIMRCTGTLEDQQETVFAEEDIGYLSGVDRTYVPKLGAAVTMDGEATYEQIGIIFSAGIENIVTPGTDGVGSGKVYQFDFPTTAPNTIKTYTIEGGDNQQAEEMEYAFVQKFGLSGAAGEALKFSADWFARQAAPTTFTSISTLTEVDSILVSKAKLYIDAASGTMGSTQKANTMLGVDLKVTTGWTPVYTGDGSTYFSFIKCLMPEVVLDVTFEHDSTAVAEIAAWRAQTARQICLKFEGAALATAGTLYPVKTMLVNLAGKWEKFSKIDEQDGNDIVTGTFRARYNATATKYAQIIVVNEIASLP